MVYEGVENMDSVKMADVNVMRLTMALPVKTDSASPAVSMGLATMALVFARLNLKAPSVVKKYAARTVGGMVFASPVHAGVLMGSLARRVQQRHRGLEPRHL